MACLKMVNKSLVWCYISVIPGTRETETRDFHFRAAWATETLSPKQIKIMDRNTFRVET
jgi:hypothetical protein